MNNKLYIYARVSTMDQVEKGNSIPGQIQLGTDLAEKLGLDVVILEEPGKSASEESLINRPVIQSLLKNVEAGEVKNLFVFKLDRLSRDNLTMAYITKTLQKNEVKVYTPSGDFDLKQSSDRLFYDIMGVIAQNDNQQRVERMKLGMVQSNRQGNFTGSIVPFGFDKVDKKLVINDEEAQVIRLIVKMYLDENKGCDSIAKELNERNIQTTMQKIKPGGYTLHANKSNRFITKKIVQNDWNAGTINSMLKNTILFGKRKFSANKGYEYVDCPAIIDESTWNQIQEKRKLNRGQNKRNHRHSYLLRELLQCGHCGQNIHGRIKENRSERVYRCHCKRNGQKNTCSGWKRNVNIDKLNSAVWSLFAESQVFRNHIIKVKNYLASDENLANTANIIKRLKMELQAFETELIDIENQKKRCFDAYIDGIIEKEIIGDKIADIVKNRKLIEDQIENTKLQIEKFEKQSPIEDIEEHIEDLKYLYHITRVLHSLDPNNTEDHEEIRSILKKFIERIIVTYDVVLKQHNVSIIFKPSYQNSIKTSIGVHDPLEEFNQNRFLTKRMNFFSIFPQERSWDSSFFFVPNCTPPFSIGLLM